jgi:hypothetical protein
MAKMPRRFFLSAFCLLPPPSHPLRRRAGLRGLAGGFADWPLFSDVAGALAGSVAPLAESQAFQPPSSARTRVKPLPASSRAAPALVASLGQAQ